jgi:hypothetical protein
MEHKQPRWLRVPITRGQSRHFLRVLTRLTPGELQQLAEDEQEEISATLIGIAVTARDAIWNRGVPSDEPLLAEAVANFANLVSLAIGEGAVDVEDAAFVWETLDWGDGGGGDPDKMALLRRAGHGWLAPAPEDSTKGTSEA